MINRVILHMNNRVYSFLNPYMRDNTLSTYADNSLIYYVKNILIMPSVSNKIAYMGKHSICGHILSGKNYEIVVTSVDFMRNNFYPMGITAIMRD